MTIHADSILIFKVQQQHIKHLHLICDLYSLLQLTKINVYIIVNTIL